MYQLSDVAECNLGKVELKPMLSAAVCGGHAWGFAFTDICSAFLVPLPQPCACDLGKYPTDLSV